MSPKNSWNYGKYFSKFELFDKMKPLFQLIFGVLITTSLNAQLSLNKDTFIQTGYSDVYEIVANGTITNNFSDSVDVVWTRIENLPASWGGSAVCDGNQCYLPNVGTAPVSFRILANAQTNLDVHFYPEDVPGDGEVILKAWVVGDSANTVITGVYKATAQQPVGIDNKTGNEDILIYPNPAKDFVMIKNLPANIISTVEVHNIFGRKMLSFSQPPSANESVVHKFDLSALAKGIYMIRVYDGDMNVIYTKSLSKE